MSEESPAGYPARGPALRAGALAAGVTALVVAVASVLGERTDEGVQVLFRDIRASTDAPLHFGVLNGFAVMLWTVAAALGLAAAALSPTGARSLPFGAGALALVFACDDLFQFHDGVLLEVGFPEKGVYLGYALAAGLLVVVHRRQLLVDGAGLLLLLAMALLAFSVVVDVISEDRVLSDGVDVVRIVLEDGSKTVGAALWATCGWLLLRRLVPPRS